MSNRDSEAGRPAGMKLTHPALRAPKARKSGVKTRRTVVRTIKLVNPFGAQPILVEVPIEPSHNNRGTLGDPTIPARHYLEKGFVLPHEFSGTIKVGSKEIDLDQVFCAVSGCWGRATVTDEPESGTERCVEHEVAWRAGEIRYAVSARMPAEVA